ncbi:MAG TPA: SafA/ExsA family spore coat assembly protein [Pseudoneobacillus sp.]|nr:SafA/ExsA family spore coat assembly protein [Pseudoneobacillus sp.]
MKIHIVQKGDTLWKIAKKYGVNFEELKKMNSQLSNPDMIMPGMKIKVPTSGGSVKKEAPIVGAKKEMPIAQQPLVKEQPIVKAPQKEAPVMPIKEAPIMPIKEAPVMPIKEAPKLPYAPKMPQPIIPDIDINNYYMLNMANMNVQQPQLPPKPTNILPEAKEVPKEAPIKETPKVEAPQVVSPAEEAPQVESPAQVEVEQPMYQEYCVPVSPILPGSGLNPGWCPPPPCPPYQLPITPYSQVQGAMNPGMMPGMQNPNYLAGVEDESSNFMPPLPMMNPSAVMGVEDSPDFPQGQPMGLAPTGYGPGPMAQGLDNCPPGTGFGFNGVPYGGQQMPFGGQQMPMQQMPYGGQQMPMQQMPYGGQQMPMQQMPYGGQQMSMQQMPFGGQQMPMQQMPPVGRQMPMQQTPIDEDDDFEDQQMQMSQMPQMPMGQMPMQLMPYGGGQMPMQQMPYGGGQMPMQQMPYGGDQMSMQQMPFGAQQMPFESPQMPMQQMPFESPQMPYGGQQMPLMQQGGNMESPEAMGMGSGMPFMSPHMSGPMNYDCGCGGPRFAPKAPINPFNQGTPGVFTPPYGYQQAQPPFMNPYGYGPAADSNRGFDESSEFY